MIDNYLWEELATFAEHKTLAKTAEALHVTQPSITRGMQKLEDELGVILFNRQPNRITLTETGELAASEAQKILSLNREVIAKISNFYQSKEIISVAFSIPGPRILLHHIEDQLESNVIIEDMLQLKNLITLLDQREHTLILSNQEIVTNEIESTFIGIEQLAVNLNKFMYQASQSSILFSELNGLSFLVLSDIGIWKKIIQENIHHTKFLYQKEEEAFLEISKYSDFPYFSTNISKLSPQFNQRNSMDSNRVTLPIGDNDAQMKIYANYLKVEKKKVSHLLETITAYWPTW
ncbi:LysR family transcriptional regulator [Enterococcus gallinarum]|uniref:LysR family transcriptional regulator n=1 Tax=Enterococcus gallinarum TaxID=1353 RepID=UPI001558E6ED|nr:LysR family transcriptional regulator [Enterococcus gallinarum]NQE03939.1 LysR family transcriptional regulator [Enterococcus gallinarum]